VRVRFGPVFSYNFRVGSGYFLSLSENFGPRPTRHTVGSGQVFFVWFGSGSSGRAAHDQVYIIYKINYFVDVLFFI
jgi:hypothetical protein